MWHYSYLLVPTLHPKGVVHLVPSWTTSFSTSFFLQAAQLSYPGLPSTLYRRVWVRAYTTSGSLTDCNTYCANMVLHSGKFLRGPNFRNFRNPWLQRKTRTTRILNTWTFVQTFAKIFTHAFCALVLLDLTMALYHNFKLVDDVLPSPMGDLWSSVGPLIKGRGQLLVLNSKIKTTKICTSENFPLYSISGSKSR